MIETLQWIAQLTDRSGLQQESCDTLWWGLTNLIVERLSSAECASIAGFITWRVQKELEYIAEFPSGLRMLIPPRLHLVVGRAAMLDADDLEESLQAISSLAPKAISAFYRALQEQVDYHLKAGNVFLWEGIGIFEGIEGEELAFYYTPDEKLLQRINKPFDAFSPTVLPQDKTFSELTVCPLDSEENLSEVPKYKVCKQLPVLTSPQPEDTLSIVPDILTEEVDASNPISKDSALNPSDNEESEECNQTVIPISSEPQIESLLPPLPPTIPPKLPRLEPIVDTPNAEPMASAPSSYEGESEVQEVDKPKSKTSTTVKIFITMAILLLIGMIGWGGFVLYQKIFVGETATSRPHREKTRVLPVPPIQDTIVPIVEETPRENLYITIKKGDRLADYARLHYGDKKFWIYIYLANQDLIENPDNVPIGTTLRIPFPEEYGIDARDAASLARADSLVVVERNRLESRKKK